MLWLAILLSQAPAATPPPTPAVRAVEFLAKEVPAWNRDNHCFSCHNNGDGARALFAAAQAGLAVPPESTRSTLDWLSDPSKWDKGPGNPAISDDRLARIQFTYALAAAIRTGALPHEHPALLAAAHTLANLQDASGAWPDRSGEAVGSPVTYGTTLATAMARASLMQADPKLFAASIEKATRWLSKAKPASTVDASALLIFGVTADATPVRKAQASDGGFGPYPGSPPEVFDTAIAILALMSNPDHAAAVAKARAYLIRTQQADGSWPETTRPSGSQSYAQRISTTSWAAMALIATAPK